MIMSAQKSHYRKFTAMLLAILILLLSVEADNVLAAFTPSLPLYIAVDKTGDVSITSGKLETPAHVVTLGKPLDASALAHLGNNLVVLRMQDQEVVYDMRSYQVSKIEFDRGYYSAAGLYYQGSALIVDVQRLAVLNESTIGLLNNRAGIPVKEGRRSCFDSVFKSGMRAVVQTPVRMRYLPFVPEDVDLNWIGSLRKDEKLIIRDKKCNAGVWLRVQRESGKTGWAKEWGLSEELVERTFIRLPEPDE